MGGDGVMFRGRFNTPIVSTHDDKHDSSQFAKKRTLLIAIIRVSKFLSYIYFIKFFLTSF